MIDWWNREARVRKVWLVRVQNAITSWWAKESGVRAIWLVWMLGLTADERFPRGGDPFHAPGVVLPPDLSALVHDSFQGSKLDAIVEFFIQMDFNDAQTKYLSAHMPADWEILGFVVVNSSSEERDTEVEWLDLATITPENPMTNVDYRLKAYRALDEDRRLLIKENVLDILRGTNTWRFTEKQATGLVRVIAIESEPNMELPYHLGIKAICTKPFENLEWADKLILRELVLVMAKRWEEFRKIVIDGMLALSLGESPSGRTRAHLQPLLA
ncbi:hypothetical protein FRB93_013787 [Tulasnella sp. JGI-2019a]|nr:hypothetical protein FRB93_013787 [Tulasnella sp. JGI-2019a]